MKILLDEMLSGLHEYLDVLGYEVTTVHDVDLKGRTDKEVAEYAYEHDLVLITEDKKPAELVDLPGGRYFYVDNKTKAPMIHGKIKEKYGK